TLVGIAGEDDLDAPDLTGPSQAERARTNSKSDGGQEGVSDHRKSRIRARQSESPLLNGELSTALSASLKAELLREIEHLGSADDAAQWAQRQLPAKNRLSATDAKQVEDAFAARLTMGCAKTPVEKRLSAKANPAQKIDKGVLRFPEPRRIRDREHVRHVTKQPCVVCGKRPSDAHHLRFAQLPALGRKVSDEFTVPLCRAHHREIHRFSDEGSWWRDSGTDPLAIARSLWLETHPLSRGEASDGTKPNHDLAPANRI